MSSSRKGGNKILGVMDPVRAEQFLLMLVNPPRGMDKSAEMIKQKFPEIAESPLMHENWGIAIDWARVCLRKAWNAADAREREWYLFKIRHDYWKMSEGWFWATMRHAPISGVPPGEETLDPPPPITAFEAVIYYFQSRVGDRAKHCGHVDCPAPYFIAEKRWQKFCSEACAGPANRESKRKWWRDNRASNSGGVR